MKNSWTLFVLTIFVNISCVTYNKCLEKFGKVGDTTQVNAAVPVNLKKVVSIEPDSLSGKINLDTLCDYWMGVANKRDMQRDEDSVKWNKLSESQRLEIKYWIDKHNRVLWLMANRKRDTVTVHVTDTVKVSVKCPPSLVVDPEKNLGGFKLLWKQFQFFAACLVLSGLLILIFWFVFFRKR